MIEVINGKTNDNEKRWLVGTTCRECLADISADAEFGYVGVQLLSSHVDYTLKLRLRSAWRALRGELAWAHIELAEAKDIQSLIDALEQAKDYAFPSTKPSLIPTAFEKAWCRETSATPAAWSNENPAAGQCAVTALIIQDFAGGTLIRGIVNGESHYWNRLASGVEVDMTASQFGAGPVARSDVQTRGRDYVLSFDATRRRYEYLKRRMVSLP